LHLLGIKFDSALTEFKSLLYESSEFTDSTSLVSEDFLCVGSADDDFSSGRRDSDFTTRVTLFSEFTSEKFVEFSVEDSVGDELGY